MVDFETAKNEALDLLKNNNITKPPVVPHKIAMDCGLSIMDATFSEKYKYDISGFLKIEERAIYINKDEHISRQTCTIAHELGHWILHRNIIKADKSLYSVLLRSKTTETNYLEQEANFFAANLLLPENMVRDYYSNIKNISTLAVIFCVSVGFISERLKFLGANK